MTKNKFDPSWAGWKPEAATKHELTKVLTLSTPTQRLEWLCFLLDNLIKFGEHKSSKIKGNHWHRRKLVS